MLVISRTKVKMSYSDCNSTVYDQQADSHIDDTCSIKNESFETICHIASEGMICPGFYEIIVNACIHLCFVCPDVLTEMGTTSRLELLLPAMGYPAQNSGLFFSVIIALLCLFGSAANIITIIVILRNKVLQATSNYLLSLAISDLIMLMMTVPVEIKFQLKFWPWDFGQFLCRLHPYLKEACLYTTALHIVAFTIERYIVICHPMRARTLLSKSRASKIICLIWLCSFILAMPVFLVYSVQFYCPGIPESQLCFPLFEYDNYLSIFYSVMSIFLFLVPMTLIIVLYSLIGKTLYSKTLTSGRRTSVVRSSKNQTKGKAPSKASKNDAVDKARHQAVKLLALIAVCFFVLWFPFMWIRLNPLFTLNKDNPNERTYHEWFYSISMTLLYLSSCTNPLLYNIMSARFRKAYKKTILCREVRSPQLSDTSMYSKRFTRIDTSVSTNFTAL